MNYYASAESLCSSASNVEVPLLAPFGDCYPRVPLAQALSEGDGTLARPAPMMITSNSLKVDNVRSFASRRW